MRRCATAARTRPARGPPRGGGGAGGGGAHSRPGGVCASVRRWLGDEDRYAYLAPDGFLAYRWRNGNDEILVELALASSAATTRALWAIIASYSSIAGTVRGRVGPADSLRWLISEPDLALGRAHEWMRRVVDAAAAVAGRGFPPTAEVTARIRLADAACPGNDGAWALGGRGGEGGGSH